MLPVIAAKTGINFFSVNKGMKKMPEGVDRDPNDLMRIDLLRPITAGSNLVIDK